MAAFDLDGTLLGPDAQVSGPTIAILRRIAARGVHLVAATGRSSRTAGPRLAVTQAVEWAVCSNGAVLYHVPTDTVVEQRTLSDDDAFGLVEAVRAVVPDAVFGWESLTSYQWTVGFKSLVGELFASREVVPDDHPLPTDLIMVMIAHPTLDVHELQDRVAPALPPNLHCTTSGFMLDVTGAGVNKASGLARLCHRVGVDPAEVVAFGDNLNDLEMLSWAGRGYAMANAHHEVVAASSHRTRLPYTKDGVADVLSELFLG